MKKLFLLLTALITLSFSAMAQRTVLGLVVSAEDGEPLVGATVLAVGTDLGTSTNIDGQFSISVPPTVKKLKVSYVGMKTQEVEITSQEMFIALEGSNVLDEVITVAYGTAKRSEYTGSAAVVGAADLQDALVASVTDALSGKVAGVQTLSDNGRPGSAPSVRIRGVGSINASSAPLYIVDGMPYEGDISLLNTQDIESMTVLKDAASTALYGARGANGVILITSKQGHSGEAKVTVDMRWGGNSRAISNYDVITSTQEYVELGYRALYNSRYLSGNASAAAAHAYANANIFGKSGTGYQIYTAPNNEFVLADGHLNPEATLGYSDGSYFYTPDNWTDNTLSNGFRQEYSIGVSGSTDRMNYYLSGAYLGDEGVITGSHFKRLSTRLNLDYQVKKWLKLGTNMSYVYTNTGYPGDNDLDASTSSGNAFFVCNMIAPVYPIFVRDADGNIMYNDYYNRPIYDYGDGKSTNKTRAFMSMSNPAGKLLYDTEDYLTDFFTGKWYALINPIDGLNITGTVGYTVDNTRLHYLTNPLYGQSASYKGEAEQVATRSRTLNLQLIASYARTFNEVHNLDFMAGYESMDHNYEQAVAYGQNIYMPNYPFVDNTIDNQTGSGFTYDYATRGYIFRAKYNYDGKYFFMGSYRRDASSRFHPDHRWGNFWSVSGAWDIAKENFMQDITAVDMLKFKVSFGQNGNDNLGSSSYGYYYAYADLYHIQGADGIWSDAALYFKGNPDITWETSNAFNIGFDFALFNGRLSGTLEYFNRQTSDMLYNKPVSPSLGYSSIPMNIGSMRNNGVELDLSSNIVKTRDITWDVNANITFGWNKVLKLAPELNGELISGSRIYREGESMYQLYLVKYAGVDPTTGVALYWTKDNEGKEVLTSSHSDAYNTNRVATGNLMPKAYGGFGTTLNAYGFDLSLSFAYQFGGKIYDNTYASLMHGFSSSYAGNNWHKDIRNAWTPENTNTDVPRLNSSDSYTNSQSDRFLISSNYLSLNNITVGYSFPKKLVNKMFLSELRLYFAAENVAVWTARKGLDPRQGYVSSNNSTYSPIRSVSGGLRVSF